MTTAVTLLAGLALLLPATTAQASQYRYWTYWWGSGSGWRYASLGPSYDNGRLSDGFVLGWRFGTTGPNGGGAQPPRYDPASIPCHATKPGEIGVALVVDFGTAADVPPGDHRPLTSTVGTWCVSVPSGSSGATVLGTAGMNPTWRASDGLVCGLDGYPSTECAALVADPAPAPTRTAAPTPTRAAGTLATGAASPTRSPAGRSPSPATSTGTTTPSRSPTPAVTSPTPTGTGAGVAVPEQTLPAAPAGALAAQSQGSSGSPWPVAGVVLLVAALGAGTWWTRRRST